MDAHERLMEQDLRELLSGGSPPDLVAGALARLDAIEAGKRTARSESESEPHVASVTDGAHHPGQPIPSRLPRVRYLVEAACAACALAVFAWLLWPRAGETLPVGNATVASSSVKAPRNDSRNDIAGAFRIDDPPADAGKPLPESKPEITLYAARHWPAKVLPFAQNVILSLIEEEDEEAWMMPADAEIPVPDFKTSRLLLVPMSVGTGELKVWQTSGDSARAVWRFEFIVSADTKETDDATLIAIPRTSKPPRVEVSSHAPGQSAQYRAMEICRMAGGIGGLGLPVEKHRAVLVRGADQWKALLDKGALPGGTLLPVPLKDDESLCSPVDPAWVDPALHDVVVVLAPPDEKLALWPMALLGGEPGERTLIVLASREPMALVPSAKLLIFRLPRETGNLRVTVRGRYLKDFEVAKLVR